MPELQAQLLDLLEPARLTSLALVLARVLGMVLLAPVLGARELPVHLRIGLAAAIALLVAPVQLAAAVPEPATLVEFGIQLTGEAVIGLTLGLGVCLFLSGMQLAGQLIATVSGLSLATVVDPQSGEETPVVSQLLHVFGIVVFLSIGGHRMVTAALLESFAALPIGRGPLDWIGIEPIAALLAGSFELGLRVAAPVMVAVLAATLITAMIGRAVPQLNALAIGLGINSLLTLAVLALSLGGAAWALEDQIEPTMDAMWEAVRGNDGMTE